MVTLSITPLSPASTSSCGVALFRAGCGAVSQAFTFLVVVSERHLPPAPYRSDRSGHPGAIVLLPIVFTWGVSQSAAMVCTYSGRLGVRVRRAASRSPRRMAPASCTLSSRSSAMFSSTAQSSSFSLKIGAASATRSGRQKGLRPCSPLAKRSGGKPRAVNARSHSSSGRVPIRAESHTLRRARPAEAAA